MFTIQRLPDELLLQTFDTPGLGSLDARAVSHVNRQWRELAMRTPSLWTSIDSRFGTHGAHAFAKRSKGLPLNVLVFVQGLEDSGKLSLILYAFMDAVARYWPRWSTLAIDALSVHVIGMVLNYCRGYCHAEISEMPPSLRTIDALTLRVHKNFAADGHAYIRAFVSPFHPRHLVLDGVSAWDMGFCSPVLERLELRNLPLIHSKRHPSTSSELDFLAEVFSACPNLQGLVLDEAGPDPTDGDPPLVELHRLQSLTVRKVPAESARTLIALLQMPILERLRLRVLGTHADLVDCLAAFTNDTRIVQIHLELDATEVPIPPLPKPKRRRKKLTVQPDPTLEPEPTFAWDHFPQLSELVLERTGIKDHAFASLSSLPALRSLKFVREDELSPSALKGLVCARLEDAGVSALRVIGLHRCRQFTHLEVLELHVLVPEIAYDPSGDEDGELDDSLDEDYEPSEVSGDSDSIYSFTDSE